MKVHKFLHLKIGFLLILPLSVLVVCCLFPATNKALFTLSDPVYKRDFQTAEGSTNGVCFDFYNKSEKSIRLIEIKMTVFEAQTGYPAFEGVGIITDSYCGQINAMEQRTIFVPLADYCQSFDDRDLKVDLFYISKIIYSDESQWNDYLGMTQE